MDGGLLRLHFVRLGVQLVGDVVELPARNLFPRVSGEFPAMSGSATEMGRRPQRGSYNIASSRVRLVFPAAVSPDVRNAS